MNRYTQSEGLLSGAWGAIFRFSGVRAASAGCAACLATCRKVCLTPANHETSARRVQVTRWPAFSKWTRNHLQQALEGRKLNAGGCTLSFDNYLAYSAHSRCCASQNEFSGCSRVAQDMTVGLRHFSDLTVRDV